MRRVQHSMQSSWQYSTRESQRYSIWPNESESTVCVQLYSWRPESGSLISLGKGAIHAKSNKQRLMTKSSTESELVGLSDTLPMVIWVRNFLLEQGYNVNPAIIYQDNMSTIAMAKKGKSTNERTRHINIRYFFVKDKIESEEVTIEYLQTDEMIADLLTKPLQGEKFRRLRNLALNWDM
mmetsp:Transcript_18891/g.27102  ORF Transcript_18891/g.27102 Transcript_18891/m.27102 type:complete len:180 (+) Transcript_18891:74-613(+)